MSFPTSNNFGINYDRDYSSMGGMGASIFNEPSGGYDSANDPFSWGNMSSSGMLDKGPMFGSYGSGGGGSQWGNIFKALDSANSWKNKEEQSGYRGGFGQGFKGGPISGGLYQDLGKGKGIFQYQPAQIAGIINHPQKQKSRGLLGTLGGIATGLAGAGVLGPWGMAAGMGAQMLDS